MIISFIRYYKDNAQVQNRMVSRSPEDLSRSFEDNFTRLVNAGERFDAGQSVEAITVAGAVYVMVHEGGKRSPSVLTMLSRKNETRFRDSGRPIDPRNQIFFQAPLTQTVLGAGEISIQAAKDSDPSGRPTLPFSKWWDGHVLRDHNGRLFSRKNLIHFFRHTLGGGHIGKEFEGQDQLSGEAFASLGGAYSKEFALNINGQSVEPKYGPEYATVRQIGWELEQTLRESFSDLIPDVALMGQNMRPVIT
jgi:hypothetical protein